MTKRSDSDDDVHQPDDLREVPCGLFRTTLGIEGKIPPGELVYYHNHGDPGPGVYPVEGWRHNKAVFADRGALLPEEGWERTLEPLAPEGFYRVTEAFHCCEKQCRSFERNDLVQLGYNRLGDALLFLPVWSHDGLRLPERGTKIDRAKVALLAPLRVVERFERAAPEPGPVSVPPGTTGYLH